MNTPQVGSPQNAFPDGPGGSDDGCGELNGVPNEDLLALALAPESMESDRQKYTERSLADLIELDKYLRGKKAACVNPAVAGWGGMRVSRVVPPDTVGPS